MNWRKLLLSANGRIGRKSFWLWVAISYSLAIVAGTFDAVIFGAEGEMKPLTVLVSLGTIFPTICVNVKRLHDTGRRGWWLLAPWAVTIIVLIVVLPTFPRGQDEASLISVFALLGAGIILFATFVTLFVWLGVSKGQPGPNKYGEPNSGDREVSPVVEVFS